MSNKMIIDASHPEETRVVVLKGDRVEEFDFESVSKKPLRGNIYLAKVTRVEPSLQAAFVDYGGNRHGFLAFSEIHPDYYQIPVADRRALLEDEAQQHRDDDEPSDERRSRRRQRGGHGQASQSRAPRDEGVHEAAPAEPDEANHLPALGQDLVDPQELGDPMDAPDMDAPDMRAHDALAHETHDDDQPPLVHLEPSDDAAVATHSWSDVAPSEPATSDAPAVHLDEPTHERGQADGADHNVLEAPQRAEEDGVDPVEHIGGDAMDETPRRAIRGRRQYKIQEVIKRRQVLLVQVVKEERGNKGAALTTYLSLAGRYSVLMPNTARGGGISRKITSTQDRDRLREIAQELEVPDGMGVILRTAGASRPMPDIKRDFEYLLRMWETVRETTLASSAPMLVYEEGSLIKRAIRDLYGREIDEILVAGEQGYREARDFMKLLMPTHVESVRYYRDTQPIFAKAGVEAQLDAMFSNQVTLKSGGYVVINQTEALVAIDVNSGRSTREHNIEDTALRTNVEAADEIARQLRLRDLAGLIVVDFIDMEEMRNNRTVERRMKDALKNDRARIQVGRISHFGLLEMSRQRIRSGVIEGSTVQCPHCMGAGVVRSTSSVALHVLRVIEDALIRNSTHDVTLRARTPVALYILNQKRAHLRDLEERFGVSVLIEADDSLTGATTHAVERGEAAVAPREQHRPAPQAFSPEAMADEEIEAPAAVEEIEAEGGEEEGAKSAEGEAAHRRRRRRRRRGGDREGGGPGRPEGESHDGAPRLEGSPNDGEDSEGESVEGQGLEGQGMEGQGLEGQGLEGNASAEGGAQEPREGSGEPRRGRRRRPRRPRFSRDGAPEQGGSLDEGEGSPTQASFGDEDGSAEPNPPEAAPMSAAPAPGIAEPAPGIAEPAPRMAEPAPMTRWPPAETEDAPATIAPSPAVTDQPQIQPVEDPNRPRRSGWWQKAKMSLIGE